MATDVEVKVDNGIAWLILHRPGTRNAVDAGFVEEAVGALDEVPVDGAGALVLAAEGPAFCVGADLDMFNAATSSGRADELLTPLLEAMHTIVRKLRALPMPTVAAIEGPAAGAGIGLACACDLRVVGESSVFVPGFTALGLSPDSGTSYHLARALGAAGANSVFLRNRRLGAFELLTCGLADEVAPDGEVWDSAARLAGEVAGASRGALLATRRLVDAAPTHSFEEHLEAEAESIKSLWNSADVVEGVAAFVQRRSPKFPGR
jgi:2-(1,2-epoxy-1,2-dihydrophenyl)acetyl-CoA isomerase